MFISPQIRVCGSTNDLFSVYFLESKKINFYLTESINQSHVFPSFFFTANAISAAAWESSIERKEEEKIGIERGHIKYVDQFSLEKDIQIFSRRQLSTRKVFLPSMNVPEAHFSLRWHKRQKEKKEGDEKRSSSQERTTRGSFCCFVSTRIQFQEEKKRVCR